MRFFRPIALLMDRVGVSKWFNDVVDFFDVYIFRTQFIESKKYFEENISRVERNEYSLFDERSRRVYRALINYRITHHRTYMKGIVDNPRMMYFDQDIMEWGKKEFFLECGGYDGDTLIVIRNLMEQKGIEWGALCFECDPDNYKLLKRNVSINNLNDNVEIIQKATWDETTELNFSCAMEQSSRVSDGGSLTVLADTIDNMISDSLLLRCFERVSFIIMDVEGAEMNSLMGAHNTISTYHPRLAISIYHSDSDMVSIIEYIHDNWPFYRLFVRHYTYLYTETVLYAIP